MGAIDILTITPYNGQIRAIQTALTASGQTGFRVGTVDKFQGQPVGAAVATHGPARVLDDAGQGAWHCTARLVYGVLHGLVLRFGGGWDLGPAGRTHASAGPLS